MFYKIEYQKRKIVVMITINQEKIYTIYDFDYEEIRKIDRKYSKDLFYKKDENNGAFLQ